jgi:hypothetical protein
MAKPRTLHVVLGSNAAACLTRSRVATPAEILVFADPLSCGALSPIVDLSAWIDERRAYWTSLGWGEDEADDVASRFAKGDLLAAAPSDLDADEIIAWVGTGLDDQIAVAWLPSFLRAAGVRPRELKVVQWQRNSRDVEIASLGMLAPTEFAARPPSRLLTEENLAELDHVWSALTSTDPTELVALVRTTSVRFPLLSRALRDGLLRYPDAVSGLNAWEMRLLQNVRRVGPVGGRVIGNALADGYELLREGRTGRDVVGDGWLIDRMFRLAKSSLLEPALEIVGTRDEYGRSEVRLTPFGQRILDGKVNFVSVNGIDDWVFGVHLQSDQKRVWFHRDGELIRSQM